MNLDRLEREFKQRQQKLETMEQRVVASAAKCKELFAEYDAVGSAWIDGNITQGELLVQAKALCEKDGASYVAWVEQKLGLKKMQASRLARIAIHKEQCRYLVHIGVASTVIDLQKHIPQASEPPVPVPAEYKRMAYTGSIKKITDGTEGTKAIRNSDDWHTPAVYVESARVVMGAINLDPFSSAQANGTVNADRFFTVEDDALTTDWAGEPNQTVFMNPPYGRLASAAIDRFIDQYKARAFSQAVVLTNSSTDTKWCQLLMNTCSAICFTDHRISFNDAGGKAQSGNTKGQLFFYYGKNVSRFIAEFGQYGFVVSVPAAVVANDANEANRRLKLVNCK